MSTPILTITLEDFSSGDCEVRHDDLLLAECKDSELEQWYGKFPDETPVLLKRAKGERHCTVGDLRAKKEAKRCKPCQKRRK